MHTNPYLSKHFSIWRDAEQLMVQTEQVVRQFSRCPKLKSKSNLGQDLCRLARQMLSYVTHSIVKVKKNTETTAKYTNRRNRMLKVKLPFLLFCTLFVTSPQAQTINGYIPDDTPDSRYTLHSDGTVTDSWTELMWQRCSLSQTWDGSTCTGSASTYTWQGALQQGESNSFAGYSDWRLPNRKELRSIVAYDRYSPAINTTVFPNTPSSSYWSSSVANYSDTWVIHFNNGDDGDSGRDYTGAVRLVRGGQ